MAGTPGEEATIGLLLQAQQILARARAENERIYQNLQERLQYVIQRRTNLTGQQTPREMGRNPNLTQTLSPNSNSTSRRSNPDQQGQMFGGTFSILNEQSQSQSQPSSNSTRSSCARGRRSQNQNLSQNQNQNQTFTINRPTNGTYTIADNLIPPPPSGSDYYSSASFPNPPMPRATSSPASPCCIRNGTCTLGTNGIPFSPTSSINGSSNSGQGNPYDISTRSEGNENSTMAPSPPPPPPPGCRGPPRIGFQVLTCPMCNERLGLQFQLYHMPH